MHARHPLTGAKHSLLGENISKYREISYDRVGNFGWLQMESNLDTFGPIKHRYIIMKLKIGSILSADIWWERACKYSNCPILHVHVHKHMGMHMDMDMHM